MMRHLAVVSDSAERASALKVRFADFFATEFVHVDALADSSPGELTFVEINLRDAARVSTLKTWRRRRPANGRAVFSVNPESHHESIQAYAIGATDIFPRPVDGAVLLRKLSRGASSAVTDLFDSGIEYFSDISASLK